MADVLLAIKLPYWIDSKLLSWYSKATRDVKVVEIDIVVVVMVVVVEWAKCRVGW